jgi:hypothetical protein
MKKAPVVALLLGLLVACRIPDLKPFSDATTEMVTVLKQGFEETRAALRGAAATADDQDAFKKDVRDLDDRWKPTRRALSALAEYSDSLTALAEAGKKGPETMAKLTGAITEMASAVGAIPLAGAGAKVIEAVGAKVIEMQAGKDIRKAVGKAAEAMDIMAPLLQENFADLRRIHGAASRALEARVLAQSSILTNYYESVSGEEQRLEYLLNLIIDYQSAPARLRWRAAMARAHNNENLAKTLEGSIAQEQADQLKRLKESDSAFGAMNLGGTGAAAAVEARQQLLMDLLTAHRKELALLGPKYDQAIRDQNRVRETSATGDRILEKAGEAIGAWQKAHHSLQAAAQGQQSRPSLSDLLSITSELKGLLK